MSESVREVLTRRTLFLRTAAAGCVIPTALKAASDSPVVNLTTGKVRGGFVDGIHVFKGIPYGEDTAKRRFKAPEAIKPWTGVRDALDYGPRAPQPAMRPNSALPQPTSPVSENCLTLNVWTPGLNDSGKRPVMVWFHGGGYNAGTANSPASDGTRLCKRGNVVVVSVNHRLNVFGYCYLAELGGPEYADSGNVGQLDLVLSLRWVRDNIASFGGDSNRVLIFGESGGGAKNATLMAMPAAHGLFHRACSSSGETVTASRATTATQRARVVLAALGLTGKNIDAIKSVSMEDLIKAGGANTYYGPVVDGGSLPRHPFDPDAPPISAHVPMMVGTNHDESRLLVGRGNPAMFNLTWENLRENLKKYSEKMGDLDLNDVITMYRRIYPDYTASDVFFAATTDSRDWRPAVVEIERRAAQPKGSAPTYSYQLDWGSPVQPQLRACHALDLPFLFDNVAVYNTLTGTSPEAYHLAEQISEAYIAFARSGDPNNAKIPHWPAYDLARRATLAFNVESKVIDDPRSEPRKVFSQVHYENPGT